MGKYYAVRKGKVPGIYTTWPEAQKQVIGYSNAEYKSFATKEEAQNFMTPTQVIPKDLGETGIEVYVDGSFNKAKNVYGSGFVVVKNNQIIEEGYFAGNDVQFVSSYQIAGEVFAALKGITWAIENGYQEVVISYDYKGIEAWGTGQWKANSPIAQKYLKEITPLKEKIKIHFNKVKAHVGITFNERADALAKKATETEEF